MILLAARAAVGKHSKRKPARVEGDGGDKGDAAQSRCRHIHANNDATRTARERHALQWQLRKLQGRGCEHGPAGNERHSLGIVGIERCICCDGLACCGGCGWR